MRKQRFNFAFNLDFPDHARAYTELKSWPSRKRGEYVIQAILKQADTASLYNTVREAVGDAFDERGVALYSTKEQVPNPILTPAPTQELAEETIGGIPADQMRFLMEMSGGAAQI